MAQTLKFGNGTWATKKGSTLAFNDEDGNYKPLPFTTTRATSATRVNKEGLIEVVTNDRPRIDYTDSADGALLLEPQRTNLITYSEAFDNAYWIKNFASVTSDAAISPDGSLNAFKLVEDTSTGTHRIRISSLASGAAASKEFTYSFFVKKSEVNWFLLKGVVNTQSLTVDVWFDLENGVIGTESNGTGKIEGYGNDWYKCSINITTDATATSLNIYGYLSEGNLSESYLGDGTSGAYIYGAQVEESSYATSYIPTQGASATRLADTASGSGNSEVFNDSEGVLFANISGLVDTDDYRIISLNAGNSTASIFLGLRSDTGNVYMYMPTDDTSYISNVNATNKFTKIALKYKTNDVSFFINGFKVFTDNTVTLPTGLNQLDLDYGNPSGSYPFNGKTKEIAYYNTILTDEELETLTSYSSLSELVTELNLNTL